MNDFPLYRAEVVEVIDTDNCYVEVADIGLVKASRSSKVKRSVPSLTIGLIVMIQMSPYDKSRGRITYHDPTFTN